MERRLFIKQLSGCCFLCLTTLKNVPMHTTGIITRTSPYGVKETIDRLITLLEENGATIYCRIDQQQEVRRTGREILPMEFILFGNPAVGGAIMAANPIAALDLPLKILVWETTDQVVKIAFNDPAYIQHRYMLPEKLTAGLDLAALINKALTINH